MKKSLFLLILFLFSCAAYSKSNSSKIKIYSWWDFLAADALQKIEKKGFQIEMTEYRSNEVALSKILNGKNDFDVVIISNWVFKILDQNKLLDRSSLNKISRERKYLKFIMDLDQNSICIPYLWATTTYAVDTRNLNTQKMDLFRLASLKKQGFKIGIIDDPIEFAAMSLLSNDEECSKSFNSRDFFKGISSCKFPDANSISKLFDIGDFRNSVKSLGGAKTAVYGWHGELDEVTSNYKFVNFVESNHRPVVGVDSVCIIKKKNLNNQVVKFVELLTSEEITKVNAEKMQYFSAYENLSVKYTPKIDSLYKNTLYKITSQNPVVLVPPDVQTQTKINQWWQKIRYERK